MNTITLNFGKILEEMETKNIELCLIKNRSWFVKDSANNLYEIELEKDHIRKEAKLLNDEYDCFSIVLDEDKTKAIFIQVANYGDEKEYLIEGNKIDSDGGFIPCIDWNRSCIFGDIDKLIEVITETKKELLNM